MILVRSRSSAKDTSYTSWGDVGISEVVDKLVERMESDRGFYGDGFDVIEVEIKQAYKVEPSIEVSPL
jgi:hypothetical protein